MPAPDLSPADQNALVDILRQKLSGITLETPHKRRRVLITAALEVVSAQLNGLTVTQITGMVNDSNAHIRISAASMTQYIKDAGILVPSGNRGSNAGCGSNQIRKAMIYRLVMGNLGAVEILRQVYNGNVSDRTRHGFRQMLKQLAEQETDSSVRERLLAVANEPIEISRYATFAIDTGQKNGARSGH